MHSKDLSDAALPLEDATTGRRGSSNPAARPGTAPGADPVPAPGGGQRAALPARWQDSDPVARMRHVDLFTWLHRDVLVEADR